MSRSYTSAVVQVLHTKPPVHPGHRFPVSDARQAQFHISCPASELEEEGTVASCCSSSTNNRAQDPILVSPNEDLCLYSRQMLCLLPPTNLHYPLLNTPLPCSVGEENGRWPFALPQSWVLKGTLGLPEYCTPQPLFPTRFHWLTSAGLPIGQLRTPL